MIVESSGCIFICCRKMTCDLTRKNLLAAGYLDEVTSGWEHSSTFHFYGLQKILWKLSLAKLILLYFSAVSVSGGLRRFNLHARHDAKFLLEPPQSYANKTDVLYWLSPHLFWARRIFSDNGGYICHNGNGDCPSSFLSFQCCIAASTVCLRHKIHILCIGWTSQWRFRDIRLKVYKAFSLFS